MTTETTELPPLEVVYAADQDELARVQTDPVASVGVLVYSDDDGPRLVDGTPDTVDSRPAGDAVAVGLDRGLSEQRGFTGKVGRTLVALGAGRGPAVVFVGCGDARKASLETLRRAGAAFVRAAGRSGTGLIVLPAGVTGEPGEEADRRAAQAVAEGALLATYRFLDHKTDDDEGQIGRLVVLGPGLAAASARRGIERAVRTARAVSLARDLVNEAPSAMTPRRLAEIAQQELGSSGQVTLEIWDEQRIADERLGGLLGVARGSAEPPRLIRASYEPADPVEIDGHVPHVVLVGKGITFDSGGLSLKTAGGMMTMKTDMSGAAAVIAALSACQDLGVRIRVTAMAPVTENMPGGRATKPGDVLTIRNGKTIEVLNTDAEGRLVLADALSLAAELEPDAIIDLATLTGACVVALGNAVAGLFGNDEEFSGRVTAASARAGEPTWPLPLPDEYRKHIDSDIADMKNIGKTGEAGAISAALLLIRFVGDVPWVHLDIAGPARSDENDGVLTKGGTGFGVRTLLELLDGYAP
ncbi:MAG TPA: leucyl aminopeptidase, partial [Acidimicrobiales bacterium]|nr:leucyl aminopeptidase [Acidimicrobiales bacterium]